MSENEKQDGETAAGGAQATAHRPGERGPLMFLGFDMDIPAGELRETIEAWSDYIERLTPAAERDSRYRALIATTLLRRGVAYAMLEEWEPAIRDFEQLRTMPEADGILARSAVLMLGSVYAAQVQDEQAIACWTTVLTEFEQASKREAKQLPEEITMLYLVRGMLYGRLERYAEAIADCDRAAGYHPDCAEVYSVRGLSRANLGDYERALTDADRSLELEPSARCYQRRAVIYRLSGRYDESIADCDRALALAPDDESIRADRMRAVLASVAQVFAAEPLTGPDEQQEQEAAALAAGEGS